MFRVGVAILLGLALVGCGPSKTPKAAALAGDCPLADAILDDLPTPTRSSLEEPFLAARSRPYSTWTDLDRGIAAKYLHINFPDLDEATVLASLFTTDPPSPSSPFKQWLQLEGFSPSVGEFLLRNFTSLDHGAALRLIREELARWQGGPKFQSWLTLAASMDPSPDLTRYVMDLHVTQGLHLTEGMVGSCRYGPWCHERLNVDLTPAERAMYLRAAADRGRSVLAAFHDHPAIFAADPDGFAQEARRGDLRGLLAAELLLASGDEPRTEAFLRDPALPASERAYWAHVLASDPPVGTGPFLERLRDDPTLPESIRRALSAPGTVEAPYVSCSQRVA
ncbi:MAG TPA: hypothetical protein VEI97_08520, partial [bacterium]|nr:hypothetical protein [bacterium]